MITFITNTVILPGLLILSSIIETRMATAVKMFHLVRSLKAGDGFDKMFLPKKA